MMSHFLFYFMMVIVNQFDRFLNRFDVYSTLNPWHPSCSDWLTRFRNDFFCCCPDFTDVWTWRDFVNLCKWLNIFSLLSQKLILSENAIFDILPSFFYHANEAVRRAALEVSSKTCDWRYQLFYLIFVIFPASIFYAGIRCKSCLSLSFHGVKHASMQAKQINLEPNSQANLTHNTEFVVFCFLAGLH